MTLHGAQAWNDPATYHPARGTEIAANVIMRLLHPSGYDAEDLCGYTLLAGTSVTSAVDPCIEPVPVSDTSQ